jgi:rhomboid protease GluP
MSEFMKKICRLLGLNYVWWHWRWLNFKRRLKESFSAVGTPARGLRDRRTICRCGALAGPGQRRCAVCGERLPSAVGRALRGILAPAGLGRAPVTGLLAAVIILDFLAQTAMGGAEGLLRPGVIALLRSGALETQLVAMGQWWRLLTCIFVHIGIIHLLFNLSALFSVSRFLEPEIGSTRFLTLFLLTGIAGSALSFALRGEVVMAGASGALFGLIGFSVAYYRRQGGAAARSIQSFMLRWAAYGFLFGLMVRADNFAHAGGFAAGFLIGSVMEIRADARARMAPFWGALAAVLFGAALLSFVLLIRTPLPI